VRERIVLMRHEQTAWQLIDDKVIVVTPQTRRVHILSGVGGKVWEYLERPKQIGELVEFICNEYEVDYQRAEKDIKDFIQQLCAREIIKPV
jgi:hypothetical protein